MPLSDMKQKSSATLPEQSVVGPAEVAMPPAPPGELPLEAVERTRAVAEVLTQLGEQADPKEVAQAVKAQTGMELDPAEVAVIQRKLIERAATPPPLDQPPPEGARRSP